MTFEQKLKVDDGIGLGNICETRREKSGRETVRQGQASGSRSNKAASVAGWVMAGRGAECLRGQARRATAASLGASRAVLRSGFHSASLRRLAASASVPLTWIAGWAPGLASRGVGSAAAGWAPAGPRGGGARCGVSGGIAAQPANAPDTLHCTL